MIHKYVKVPRGIIHRQVVLCETQCTNLRRVKSVWQKQKKKNI